MNKWFRSVGIVLALAVFSLNFLPIALPKGLPERLYLNTGEEVVISTGLPLSVSMSATSSGSSITVNGSLLLSAPLAVDLRKPLTITASGAGVVRLCFSIAGITIRNMTLLVDQDRVVIPGGQCIGVAMYTKGALVVSVSDILLEDGSTVNPGKLAGILEGDVILSVNGVKIHNANHLGELINDNRESLRVTVLRKDKEIDLDVTPVKDTTDGRYRVGLWVRDSTAGIGTMTYADPQNLSFAGLGHAIADVDTSENLLLKEGQIVPARIIDVIKGEDGSPGELCGVFVTSGNALGKILANSEQGLFGRLYQPVSSPAYPNGLPIGWQNEVQVGHATILCTVSEQTIEEYDCQIVRVNRQRQPAGKGMVIEITDPRLLGMTNGIVQGMSGSPVIQNGKIVGAITHVLVSDPHKGYGIFIEWMLAQSDKL